MKFSKAYFEAHVYKIPEIKFEGQKLSSYSGLILFQRFFQKIDISKKLKSCFNHLSKKSVVGFNKVILILITNFILGFRKIADTERYNSDGLVKRLLGLKKLPSSSTITRTLARCDEQGYNEFRLTSKQIVIDRLAYMKFNRITCDFDGSVLSTKRKAEDTAVGYNKKKKGLRSYYPLFATIAQTGQVFDFLHRPGNVHDSNGAREFIHSTFKSLKANLPTSKFEARLDSAFFSDKIVSELDDMRVDFTISVPFERFVELKGMVENRKRWKTLDDTWSYFTTDWSPQCWEKDYQFIFLRQTVKCQDKNPIQLDLFKPHEFGYDFKVIVTNRKTSVKNILHFHNGRGYQENIFSELKSQCQLENIPFRRKIPNLLYHQSAVLTHNLFREFQMKVYDQARNTTAKRKPLWIFFEANTIRQKFIHLAGRLTEPGGKLTLTMNGNAVIEKEFRHLLEALAA